MTKQTLQLPVWFFIAAFIFSCSTDDIGVDSAKRIINVKLTPGGEIDLEDESPIGGRTEGDLGIVYGVTINRKVDGNEQFYTEGIFNSLNSISAELFSDENYIVYFSAIKDGTSLGLVYEEEDEGIILENLFNESDILLSNQFSQDKLQFYLQSNSAAVYKPNGDVDWTGSTSLVDRFDGKIEVSNPNEEDSVLNIPLRRTSFGLAIRVDNIDSNDTLNIELTSAPGSPFYYQLTQSANLDYQIRTLEDDGFQISDDQEVRLYSSFKLRIYNESGVFEREKLLSTQDLIGKRNVKRTYVLDLDDFGNGIGGRGSFDLEYLDDEMIDEGEIIIGG